MKPYQSDKSKKEEVRSMFDAIAWRYDTLNHLLSLGIDRGWRCRVVCRVKGCGAERILDVATGTGDLALMLARAMPAASVRGVDLSEEMLARARQKAGRAGLSPQRVSFAAGDAEALEAGDGAYDAVTVAFGVRNFEDIPAGLAQMQRVLRPGGRLFVLEFGLPRNRLLGALYGLYFHRILPLVGRLISRDRHAYTYLPRSVDAFPYGAAFVALMKRAGFRAIRCTDLFGGVAQLYEGEKPQ